MMLDCCKWGPQVGDQSVLAPFALVIPHQVWHALASAAERLAAEAEEAEQEILRRAVGLARLGLPPKIEGVLAARHIPPSPSAARVVRFDFHPTAEGWRISEANSDVPGGYIDAGAFTILMAGHFPGLRPAGDPAAVLVQAIAARVGGFGRVALVAPVGYMEDHEIVTCLAQRFAQYGLEPRRCHPRQIRWAEGRAYLETPSPDERPTDAVLRFYQGEWLSSLPAATGWFHFLRGGRTPICNPGTSLVVESKRFPLLWDHLSTRLDTWRELLPETRDPRKAPWRRDRDWLLKTAFCNTGDTVASVELSESDRWRRAAWSARMRPSQWIAQRRFETLPLATPDGPRYACLGVYTVDGTAAGIYGRIASNPVIDFAATDVAVLIED